MSLGYGSFPATDPTIAISEILVNLIAFSVNSLAANHNISFLFIFLPFNIIVYYINYQPFSEM